MSLQFNNVFREIYLGVITRRTLTEVILIKYRLCVQFSHITHEFSYSNYVKSLLVALLIKQT